MELEEQESMDSSVPRDESEQSHRINGSLSGWKKVIAELTSEGEGTVSTSDGRTKSTEVLRWDQLGKVQGSPAMSKGWVGIHSPAGSD